MARLVACESYDVDDQAEALSGWTQSYEQLGRGRFRGSVRLMTMAQGVLLRESTNRPLREEFSPPPGHVAITLPLVVTSGSVLAGRAITCESLAVLDGDDRYEMVLAGEMEMVGMSVHRDVLGSLAPATLEWCEQVRRQGGRVLALETAAAIRSLFATASREAEASLDAPDAAGIETALLVSTLECVLMRAMADKRDTPSTLPRRAHARLQIARRAIDFMRAHMHHDIGVPEISRAAYTSRRTLQYCFEELLHATPQAYLRALRLNEARRQLKACNQPITSVAVDCGFSSASHFTWHYKRMFDELPSETLRRHGPVRQGR